MSIISLSRDKIKKEGGVVILSLKEYQKLIERAAQSFYLKGREADKVDTLVKNGLKEYKAGRTKSIKSLSELD